MSYVYHYTTEEGFKGIIESQELWATSIYCLNDWTEFEYGRDALIESARVLLKGGDAADVAAQLLSYLYDVHPSLYVCSFSTAGDGDDLSQWRAYCPKGGYAIGFPTAKLHQHMERTGMGRWGMMECEYGTVGAGRFVEGLVRIMEEIFKMAGGAGGFRAQFPFNDPDKDGLLAQILEVIAKYKHEAFRAEQEWRLVYRLTHGNRPRFRTAGGALIPYIAFSLKSEDLWRQAQIVMSPCLPDAAAFRQQTARAFLEGELAKHSLPTDCARSIRPSEAPYRTLTPG